MSEQKDTDQPTVTTDVATAAPAVTRKKHNYVAEGFKNRTTGEGLFNFGSYFGVGYLGVTAVSVAMSWLFRDSKAFSPTYNKWVSTIIEKTKGARTGAALESYAKKIDSNMTIAAMFTGGTIMSVLPIKALEDNKAKIVEGLDRGIYGNERVDNDPFIREAHADLADAPRQTWLSVFLSRGLAFALTFGTSMLMGSNDSPIAKLTGKSIDRQSIHMGRWLDSAVHHNNPGALEQIAKSSHASPNDMLRTGHAADRIHSRIYSYLSLDAFYTVITSGSLYIFTRMFGPMFDSDIRQRVKEDKQIAKQDAPAHHIPNAPAHADLRVGPSARVSHAETTGRLQADQAELTPA